MADNAPAAAASSVKCSDGGRPFDSSLKSLRKMFNPNNVQSGCPAGGAAGGSNATATAGPVDRLKILYPNVNEAVDPLPRSWSLQDKCSTIGLTQNNLRVHYKGIGKSHTDAASVRTAFPIPAACGLYYFEVKIISKGRDGYMGIGLTHTNFKMNRLPGWDKQSYGYHGDDGNSFCSSGNGQPYGPTFTTGDIIGCGVNLVDNTCFYTKNGHHLGIAFRDLPPRLYPTVGLQTPGEVVDANFGQEPFKFDIEDMLKELRAGTRATIYNFPLPDDQGDWTVILHKMVSSYLVHHGYSSTAETFARTTGQALQEDMTSIKNRQKIIKLVLSGRMGQAIEQTIRLYPGLLESNQNLLFMLKCRQFIEMVNGSDFDLGTPSSRTSPVQTSVIQSTKSYQNGNTILPEAAGDNQGYLKNNVLSNNTPNNNGNCIEDDYSNDVEMENGHSNSGPTNGYKNGGPPAVNRTTNPHESVEEVEDEEEEEEDDDEDGHDAGRDEDMDVDSSLSPNCKSANAAAATTKSGVERMLEFGRELFQMSQRLEKEHGVNETNQKMLEDAFSLLAYSNPWASPLGWQLCPSRREAVCAALNSAILQSMNYSWRPPLEVCIAHACELLRLMSSSSLGACAFVSVEDILAQHQQH
ncbi:ran-binding protein 9 [Anopheles ziemanni]|uniref:ran-binding protein 9 n=1 Tax=Anopheles coustani TaxID=139045 RepID=UPI0026594AE8|nr:ran-binding protein 9 [Anopheles coustani]XP_058167343.1 ran-binding protein 9 [Anopheles ziemanni]